MAITIDPEEHCGGETIMSEAEVIAAYQALLRQAYESNPLRTAPARSRVHYLFRHAQRIASSVVKRKG